MYRRSSTSSRPSMSRPLQACPTRREREEAEGEHRGDAVRRDAEAPPADVGARRFLRLLLLLLGRPGAPLDAPLAHSRLRLRGGRRLPRPHLERARRDAHAVCGVDDVGELCLAATGRLARAPVAVRVRNVFARGAANDGDRHRLGAAFGVGGDADGVQRDVERRVAVVGRVVGGRGTKGSGTHRSKLLAQLGVLRPVSLASSAAAHTPCCGHCRTSAGPNTRSQPLSRSVVVGIDVSRTATHSSRCCRHPPSARARRCSIGLGSHIKVDEV